MLLPLPLATVALFAFEVCPCAALPMCSRVLGKYTAAGMRANGFCEGRDYGKGRFGSGEGGLLY